MDLTGSKSSDKLSNQGRSNPQPDRLVIDAEKQPLAGKFGASMSPHPSSFSPLLYAGRLDEGLEALSSLGFAAVEVSLRQADEVDIQWLETRLAHLGLVISAIASGRTCLEGSLCLTDTNPIARQQVFERLVAFIQLASHFNAPVIIGGVRGKLSGDAQQKSAQYDSAVETLHRCAAIADVMGVPLLIEPINRYETNFVNTANEGMKLIEVLGHASLKLLLDTFHMNIEEADPCSTIHAASQYLGYVHFADSNRCAPGWGHIDFPQILLALTDVGYHGFITAEILPVPDDAQALRQAGEYLQSLMVHK